MRTARAVWSNRGFGAHLVEAGLDNALLRTDYVTDWFKSDPARLVGTGFTTTDDLTVDHVVPKELGGIDSKFNMHLMLRSDNSRFGMYYTPEKVEYVGALNAKVAQRVVQLARRQGLDRYDESDFDPLEVQCPAPSRKRPLDADLEAESDPESEHKRGVMEPMMANAQMQGDEHDEDEKVSQEVSVARVEMPHSAAVLFKRMSDPCEQFGVSQDRSSAMAAKPMRELKQFCEEIGVPPPAYGYNQPLPDEYVIIQAPKGLRGKLPSYLKMICVKVLSYLVLSTYERTRMFPFMGTRANSGKWMFLMQKRDLPVLRLFASKESEEALKREQKQTPTLAIWERMQSMLADATFPVEPVGGSPVINVAALSHLLKEPFFNVLLGMRGLSMAKAETFDATRTALLTALNEAIQAVRRAHGDARVVGADGDGEA